MSMAMVTEELLVRERVSPAELARVLRGVERDLDLVPEVPAAVRVALERASMAVNSFELGGSMSVARVCVEYAVALAATLRGQS
jgi:hypothetical protein